MERQFGFGGPFFFPRRRFFPFFFIFPFFFPFFRGEEERDNAYYSRHECGEGDSLRKLAKKYNVPQPILAAVNPQVQDLTALSPGTVMYIPRMDKMHCQTMYMEEKQGMPNAQIPNPALYGQQAPNMAMPAPYVGQPTAPYTGMQFPMQQSQPFPNIPMTPPPYAGQPAAPYMGTPYPMQQGQQAPYTPLPDAQYQGPHTPLPATPSFPAEGSQSQREF